MYKLVRKTVIKLSQCQGSALILVLLVTSMLLILGASALKIAGDKNKVNYLEGKGTQALYAADSALETNKEKIKQEINNKLSAALNPSAIALNTKVFEEQNGQIGDARYNITVKKVYDDYTFLAVIQTWMPGTTVRKQVYARYVANYFYPGPTIDVFKNVITADNSINIKDDVNGDIFTNGNVVHVDTVNGDVYAGGTAKVINPNGSVTENYPYRVKMPEVDFDELSKDANFILKPKSKGQKSVKIQDDQIAQLQDGHIIFSDYTIEINKTINKNVLIVSRESLFVAANIDLPGDMGDQGAIGLIAGKDVIIQGQHENDGLIMAGGTVRFRGSMDNNGKEKDDSEGTFQGVIIAGEINSKGNNDLFSFSDNKIKLVLEEGAGKLGFGKYITYISPPVGSGVSVDKLTLVDWKESKT